MKTRRTLWRTAAAFVGGCAVVSAITALPAASNLHFDGAGFAPVMRLMQHVFTPASVMAQSRVEGRGKVISVAVEKQELVLEHGDIKGFMDAMTMGYKVSSPSLLKGLKPGDQVSFTIDPKKSVITKVAKLKN